jgi:hypothetical protein
VSPGEIPGNNAFVALSLEAHCALECIRRTISNGRCRIPAGFYLSRSSKLPSPLDRFGERYPFLRQRQLAGLDQREIEDFVDQLQQVPPRLENLIDASLLGGRWRRRTGIL